MTLNDAVKIFVKEYPGYRVVGYWKKSNGYVLNTKPFSKGDTPPIPGQFMVENNGIVYGVNPMIMNLNLSDMIKINS